MKLLDYISALIPNLKKDSVLEDIRITADELNNGIVPAWIEASRFFSDNKLKAKETQALDKSFYFNLGKGKKNNFVLELVDMLPKLAANLAYINREIELNLEATIVRDAITAKKTMLIRSADQMSFLVRYMAELLNYVYCFETKARSTEPSESFAINKMQITNLEKTFTSFVKLWIVYAQDPKVFAAKYTNVPDIIVNMKNFSVTSATLTESAIDPFGTPLMAGFESNPIYHFRLMITEWQSDRYKAFKEKKRSLELKLLNLEMSKSGTPNPKLEQEITHIQKRIDGYDYKLAKFEESVA